MLKAINDLLGDGDLAADFRHIAERQVMALPGKAADGIADEKDFEIAHIGVDGISPDRMSYGFAYKPNAEGTPFGASRYRVFRLGDDWYWFRVSDDWY